MSLRILFLQVGGSLYFVASVYPQGGPFYLIARHRRNVIDKFGVSAFSLRWAPAG